MPHTLLRFFSILTLSLGLFSLNSFASDPFSLSPLQGFDQSFSPAVQQPFSSSSFLRVEEAYRLSAIWSDGTLQLNWQIAPGYYLYQHQLSLEQGNNPLGFERPTGTQKYDDYFEKELEVYYQQLTLNVAAADNTHLQVKSQGCADAGLCYPPQTQTIQIKDGQASLIASPAPGIQPSLTNPTQANNTGAINWGLLATSLMGALLGGIILNLMPCVFPVLSIKALSLAKAHEAPQRQHLHGWSYTADCVATFVGIAAIMFTLRAGGEAIGWGFQLQSPSVVGSLAYLFLIMALLMYGSFQWAGSFSGIGQKLTQGDQLPSSFFTGVLATLVASPCTAPFMGGALGYAVTLPASVGLLIFAALGFGMALPFLLLSYSPQLGRKLPKPGRWMEGFKQLLAFPLLLTAVWLVWIFGRQTGSDQSSLLLAGALSLCFALWLTQRPWLSAAAKSLRFALIIGCLVIAYQPLGGATASTERKVTANQQGGWQTYTAERLAELRSNNLPVFINLTADWCITCLANEKLTLSREPVLAAFEAAGVTLLKGDWTHYNAEITELLAEHGRNGVPLYLLYSADGHQAPQILPQVLRESDLLDTLSKKDH